jgi:hypothetical protein
VRKTAALLLIVMSIAVFAAGCGWPKSAASNSTAPVTQTIAPAAGQPSTNGGDAVTQTVDIEDGRSEDDGGVLTNPRPGKTTTAAKPPAKPPVKKKK